MTIQVELVDGAYCRVVPKGLDLLLNKGLVKRFRRTSGWATIGIDSVRAPRTRSRYSGPERRLAA